MRNDVEALACVELADVDRAVAFAMDDILLFGLIANSKNPADYEVVGESLQVEPYACMLPKDDPAFKKLVDDTFIGMMKSGEFEKLYTKWFMSPIPPKNPPKRPPKRRRKRTRPEGTRLLPPWPRLTMTGFVLVSSLVRRGSRVRSEFGATRPGRRILPLMGCLATLLASRSFPSASCGQPKKGWLPS